VRAVFPLSCTGAECRAPDAPLRARDTDPSAPGSPKPPKNTRPTPRSSFPRFPSLGTPYPPFYPPRAGMGKSFLRIPRFPVPSCHGAVLPSFCTPTSQPRRTPSLSFLTSTSLPPPG
jgi:hypothetical protein